MNEHRTAQLGTDLRLRQQHRGADLVVDGAGDLALVAGVANIVQALPLHLRIRRGELAALGQPRHGSRVDELIGEPDTTRTRVMLLARVREAVERDPRVTEVRDLRAEALPGERNVLRVTLQAELVSASTVLTLVHDLVLEPT